MKFQIVLPPDPLLHSKVIKQLKSDSEIKYRELQRFDLMEGVDDIVNAPFANVIVVSGAAVLVAALKCLSPVLLEWVKGMNQRSIAVEVGEAKIHVSSSDQMKVAVKAATDLSKSAGRQ